MNFQPESRPTPGIVPAGELDIVAVSEMLSDDRTACTLPHHPSLRCEWECAGRSPKPAEPAPDYRPDLLAADDEDQMPEDRW